MRGCEAGELTCLGFYSSHRTPQSLTLMSHCQTEQKLINKQIAELLVRWSHSATRDMSLSLPLSEQVTYNAAYLRRLVEPKDICQRTICVLNTSKTHTLIDKLNIKAPKTILKNIFLVVIAIWILIKPPSGFADNFYTFYEFLL